MKTIYKLRCPEHGIFSVEIEEKSHIEFRDMLMYQSDKNLLSGRFTAKCPKCGKRIEVQKR